MLEQIAQLVKQYGQDAVVNNPDIPNENNNAVMAEATKTITSGMQNLMAGGGLENIISMFTGGGNAGSNNQQSSGIGGLLKNPVVTMMIGHFISKLTGKFNMSPAQANQVSTNLIPNVLNDLIGKTTSTEPQNSGFNLNDLIGSLTGGGGNAAPAEGGSKGFDFQGLLNQFTGGGSAGNGGGGFDLQDIISQVTKGAQQNRAQEKQGGGGIGDLIKGFFN
jgi:hypothetical protein